MVGLAQQLDLLFEFVYQLRGFQDGLVFQKVLVFQAFEQVRITVAGVVIGGKQGDVFGVQTDIAIAHLLLLIYISKRKRGYTQYQYRLLRSQRTCLAGRFGVGDFDLVCCSK